MDESETNASPASRIAAVLMQFEANRCAVFDWLDPSWLPEPLASLRASDAPIASPECANALLNTLMAPPPFEAFEWPGAYPGEALAVLPVADALRMLRIRALLFRRAELRRLVDRESRAHLGMLLGDGAPALLRWMQAVPGAPDVDRLAHACGMPALSELSSTELGWEGYCLFRRDGVWRADGPAALVRLALPRRLDVPAWLVRSQSDGGTDSDDYGGSMTLGLLPYLFPERLWSFGCDKLTSN